MEGQSRDSRWSGFRWRSKQAQGEAMSGRRGRYTRSIEDTERGSSCQLTLHSLSLESQGAPNGAVTIKLENLNSTEVENLKKNPMTIKEGVEYNVAISFR